MIGIVPKLYPMQSYNRTSKQFRTVYSAVWKPMIMGNRAWNTMDWQATTGRTSDLGAWFLIIENIAQFVLQIKHFHTMRATPLRRLRRSFGIIPTTNKTHNSLLLVD